MDRSSIRYHGQSESKKTAKKRLLYIDRYPAATISYARFNAVLQKSLELSPSITSASTSFKRSH
jgi:hypothetical protein